LSLEQPGCERDSSTVEPRGRREIEEGPVMAFDGEAFVAELRQELVDSGRTLDKAVWIEKVTQGEATPQELVGWARQHYWGVTYHTRRFLSIWVGASRTR
jgi:hypothetical protein